MSKDNKDNLSFITKILDDANDSEEDRQKMKNHLMNLRM